MDKVQEKAIVTVSTYSLQSLELNKQLYSTWKLIALHKVYTFIEP
jgi:hypothetical protein